MGSRFRDGISVRQLLAVMVRFLGAYHLKALV